MVSTTEQGIAVFLSEGDGGPMIISINYFGQDIGNVYWSIGLAPSTSDALRK